MVDSRRLRRSPHHRRSLRRLAPASRQSRRPRKGKGSPTYEDEDEEGYGAAEASVTASQRARASSPQSRPPRPSMLLEALKEELFQLEVERQQGRISHQEYEDRQVRV
jgi:hypothetical protein